MPEQSTVEIVVTEPADNARENNHAIIQHLLDIKKSLSDEIVSFRTLSSEIALVGASSNEIASACASFSEIASVCASLRGEVDELRKQLALEQQRNDVFTRQRSANIERIRSLTEERDRLELELQRSLSKSKEKHTQPDMLADLEETTRRLKESQSRLETLERQLSYNGLFVPSRAQSKPSLSNFFKRRSLLSSARKAMRSQDYRTAANNYASLLALDSSRLNVWTQFGHSLRSFDTHASLRAYLKALQFDPTNIDTCLHLGHLLKDMGRREDAILVFSTALSVAPDFEPIWDALRILDIHVESMNAVARTNRRTPVTLRQIILLSRARTAALRSDWKEAARRYRRLLALKPLNATWLIQLGHAEKEGGDLDCAEKSYRSAVAAEPLNWDAHFQLAHFLRLRGDHDGSGDQFRLAVILDPDTVTD